MTTPRVQSNSASLIPYEGELGLQPPSISRARDVIFSVDPRRCQTCGKCVEVCSVGAIQIEKYAAVINARLCIGCGACLDTCPTAAIDKLRSEKTF